MNPNKARFLLRAIGLIGICLAVVGLWYNLGSLLRYQPGIFDLPELEQTAALSRSTYFLVSVIYITCYLSLLWCGIKLMRLQHTVIRLFTWTLYLEVLMFLVIVVVSLHPKYGPSILAVAGLAGGGFVPQLLLLYPLWAPFVARWAAKQLTTE
jgi:hypothetical protein